MSDSDTADKTVTEALDEMDEEKRREFEEKAEELAEKADEELQLGDEEMAAFESLQEPEDETAIITMRGNEIVVKTYLNQEIETKLDRIEQNKDNIDAIRSDLIDVMAWIIEDGQYSSKAVWSRYAEEYGVMALTELFYEAVEPALDRVDSLEQVKNSQGPRKGH